MDTSVEATALSDNNGSDNLVALISSSAEEHRLCDVASTSSDIKLAENGEIMSESASDNFATEGNVDANFCVKSSVSCSSSSVTCENNPVRSVDNKTIRDCRSVDRDESHVRLVSDTNANTDGDNDDDGEIADSRSQTPLQDELEPEVDELNQNQAAANSNTVLDPSTVMNPSHDSTAKTKNECSEVPECMSTALQDSREENGEVSDDDDEGVVEYQVNAGSVSQQLPVDVKPLHEEKPTKESESQQYSDGELEEGEHEASDHSTDGELDDDDECEEGEIKEVGDESPCSDGRPHIERPLSPPSICRFYLRGMCTWGGNCRYHHPGPHSPDPMMHANKGPLPPPPPVSSWIHDEPGLRYRPRRSRERELPRPPAPPPDIKNESAWERGLRHAKESRRKRLASGAEEHREPAVELPPCDPPMMPPVAVCEPVPLPALPPVHDAVPPLPGPPPVMLPVSEPFPRFSPPPPFDEPFKPAFFDRPVVPLPPPPEAWQHHPPVEPLPWGRGLPPPEFPPRFLPPPEVPLDVDRGRRLSPPSPRFEGRRELPFPPRFERGPPGPPEGPMDNVRAAAGPLPAPPVAWSRGSEDWKDPWLRSRSPVRKRASRSLSRGRRQRRSCSRVGSFSSVSSSSASSRSCSRSSSSCSSYSNSSCSSYSSRSKSRSPHALPASTLGQSIRQRQTVSIQDKIEQRLATLASMPGPGPGPGPGPALHDPLRLPDKQRSPPGWKPSQRLAAPPPADGSLRHTGNKSPPYRSKVVVPGNAEAASKTSHMSADRRSGGTGRDARPPNRSPVGDRSRDGMARRPRSENLPITSDRQPPPPRTTRPAGDGADHLRNNTSSAARDAGRQGTTRGVKRGRSRSRSSSPWRKSSNVSRCVASAVSTVNPGLSSSAGGDPSRHLPGPRSAERDRSMPDRSHDRSREKDAGDKPRSASGRSDHGTASQRDSRPDHSKDGAGERGRDTRGVPDRQPVKTAAAATSDSRAKSTSASSAGGQLTTSTQPRSSSGSLPVRNDRPSTDRSLTKADDASSSSQRRPSARESVPSSRTRLPESRESSRSTAPRTDGPVARHTTGMMAYNTSAPMPPLADISSYSGARSSASSAANAKRQSMTSSRREELLEQLKAVEDAIAKKRSKMH